MKATETNVMQAMKTTHQHEMDEVQELLVQERQEKAELERSMKKLKELDVHVSFFMTLPLLTVD